MPLYQSDILLERARLHHAQGSLDKARDFLSQARTLIEKHSYHRRDPEVGPDASFSTQPELRPLRRFEAKLRWHRAPPEVEPQRMQRGLCESLRPPPRPLR